ncbi:hypothetical protein OAH18_03255 [bacterium]|nr:hypothetical protein [bacterium]
MNPYSSLADDFYINMNLNTEMKLPNQRETVLEFFERVQKSYPTMRNFYTRENGDFVLEEEKGGQQRWLSMEPRRVCSGFINPPDNDDAMTQHELVLQLVPYMLSVSPLDCEALDYMLGFDFNYRGNHDQLVANALGSGSALEGMCDLPGTRILNFEPSMTVTLDEDCRLQARLVIETRTNAYQVRRGEFPEDQISVYFTVRQYGSLNHSAKYDETLKLLKEKSEELMDQYIIEQVLVPLSQAISAS